MRRGMTLVEVLIAVAISGLVLLGGLMLLDQLNDQGARIARDGGANNTEGNADRVLRRLLADAQTASDSARRFQGNEYAATYMSLCDVPGGWRESCRVTLVLDSLRDSSALIAQTDRGDAYSIFRAAGHLTLRYLDLAAHDSAWVREWAPSVALPGAVAAINGTDTVLFPLGAARE